MRKESLKGKMQLSSYDDILSGGVKHHEGEITEMPLVNLHSFKKHPFKVLDDEHMAELVESIKEKGVLSPAVVRKRKEGGYEIISGHRRKHACELAGLVTMPVIIKEMDDDEATILMVDANIQREHILPSERAFALQMKMKARKNQGKRNDLTSGTEFQKSDTESEEEEDKLTSGTGFQKSISDEIGEEEGISGRQVRQYVRLTNLLPGILERVDNEKIGIKQAVELSFIDKPEQKIIHSILSKTDRKLTARQAKLLRTSFESGMLDEDEICDILIGKMAVSRTVTLTEKELSLFFPDNMDGNQVKEAILGILEKQKEESE